MAKIFSLQRTMTDIISLFSSWPISRVNQLCSSSPEWESYCNQVYWPVRAQQELGINPNEFRRTDLDPIDRYYQLICDGRRDYWTCHVYHILNCPQALIQLPQTYQADAASDIEMAYYLLGKYGSPEQIVDNISDVIVLNIQLLNGIRNKRRLSAIMAAINNLPEADELHRLLAMALDAEPGYSRPQTYSQPSYS